MALIFPGKTECSLCGNIISASDEIVATSHLIADGNDPLWRFSDSAMHRSCFLTWDQRVAFVAKFNQLVGGTTFGNGTYHQMESDGTIAVLKRDNLNSPSRSSPVGAYPVRSFKVGFKVMRTHSRVEVKFDTDEDR